MKQLLKQSLISLAVILILISSVLSENSPVQNFVVQQSDQLKGRIIPEPFGSLFNNEKINFHLKLNNGKELIFGVDIIDKKLNKVQAGEFTNPSLRVFVDESTLIQLQTSKNPLPDLKKAYDDGKISYKGVGVYNKLKFTILSTFMKVSPLFTKLTKKEVPQNATIKIEEKTAETKLNATTGAAENKTTSVEAPKVEVKEENKTKTLPPIPSGPQIYIVNQTNSGFDTMSISIKAGDTIIWKNIRSRNPEKAMIIGTQLCTKIRSGVYLPGDSFQWTFDNPGTCTVVDGIYTTQLMNVVVK